jgi:hypothetical protein
MVDHQTGGLRWNLLADGTRTTLLGKELRIPLCSDAVFSRQRVEGATTSALAVETVGERGLLRELDLFQPPLTAWAVLSAALVSLPQ